MTYQVVVSGHCESAEQEAKVTEAARAMVAEAASAGTVGAASMSGQYSGSVDLMPEQSDDSAEAGT